MAPDRVESASEDMVPMYGMVLSGETPSLIADLRSIETDLRYAARLFERVAHTSPDGEPDLRRALYDAGAIAYRRGFTSGRSLVTKGRSRSKVPDDILDSLDPEVRRAHEAVLERANTHIAHRVSEAEQGRVLLLLNNPSMGQAIQGIGYFSARFVGPSVEDALRDVEVAQSLADSVAAFVEIVQGELLEAAKERDLESLYDSATPMGD
jgi:hypothetical protein